MENYKSCNEIEGQIDYIFSNKDLLATALTHSSYSNEKGDDKDNNNERLEFLGDAVLELTVSEFVYNQHIDFLEGDLTKKRAAIVCEPSLSYCAKQLSLGEYLLLGKGEDTTGGRDRESILADALEAIIGAIYLDGGFSNAKEFVNEKVIKVIDNKKLFFDSKTILQEIVQSKDKGNVVYELLLEEGPDHNKVFTSAVLINNKQIGIGKGRTKKAAEQEAASQAIEKLKAR